MPEIFLHVDGQQTGPYQADQVRQLLAEGKISAATPAWQQGLAQWSTVGALLPTAGSPPAFAPPPPAPMPAKQGMSGCMIAAIVAGAVMVLLVPCCAGIALGPITAGIHKAKENAALQTSRAIGLSLYAYSVDHNGAYPEGKTSTEVFQKLLDEKYVSDPGLFYLEMPGKTRATSNTLTADNVCFDVTGGLSATSSDSVPVVFCTGYIVTYAAGASAVRDPSSSTPFPGPGNTFTGIAVTYKNNSSRFLAGDANGTVANFIPPGFDAGGNTYQQLKP